MWVKIWAMGVGQKQWSGQLLARRIAAAFAVCLPVWASYRLYSWPIAVQRKPFMIFCTSELEHLTSGGAGIVVADSARALFQGGWHVLIILDVIGETEKSLEVWKSQAKLAWGRNRYPEHKGETFTTPSQGGDISLMLLSALTGDFDHRVQSAWQKSLQWALAIDRFRDIATAIEFWDYGGPAYHSLIARTRNREHQHSPKIWIRTHGTQQDIDGGGAPSNAFAETVFKMESRALQLADHVIANTHGIARQYVARYGLDPRRVIVIAPTLGTLEVSPAPGNLDYSASLTRLQSRNVLVYGKLQHVKGSDRAASALALAMQNMSARHWNGTVFFAGDDMPCDQNANINMSTCIRSSVIPSGLLPRFRFVGRIKRGSLGSFAATHRIRFAVMLSRYETFCLAAHEAAYFGIALLLPKLAAYEGYFVDKQGCMMFEASASAEELAGVIQTALETDQWMRNVRGPITYLDPLQKYAEVIDSRS